MQGDVIDTTIHITANHRVGETIEFAIIKLCFVTLQYVFMNHCWYNFLSLD